MLLILIIFDLSFQPVRKTFHDLICAKTQSGRFKNVFIGKFSENLNSVALQFSSADADKYSQTFFGSYKSVCFQLSVRLRNRIRIYFECGREFPDRWKFFSIIKFAGDNVNYICLLSCS